MRAVAVGQAGNWSLDLRSKVSAPPPGNKVLEKDVAIIYEGNYQKVTQGTLNVTSLCLSHHLTVFTLSREHLVLIYPGLNASQCFPTLGA